MIKNLCYLIVIFLVIASCTENEEITFSSSDIIESPGIVLGEDRTDGNNGGYFWTVYKEGGQAEITFPSANQWAGNFQITYSNNKDIVGGKGWRTGSGRTINYNVGSAWGSRDFIGVYGWTQTPLIEYYICEFDYGINGSDYVNSKTINGKKYDFWTNVRVNKPSILGTKTFYQYIDRYGAASTGQNGAVNVQAHLNNWNQNGPHKNQWGNMRNFDYQVFALEAFNYKSGGMNATIWKN